MTTTSTPPIDRTTIPAWMTWVPRLAVAWAVAYGGVRVWFATGHEPDWELPTDLLVSGWWAAAMCLATAAVVVALRARPGSRPLMWLAWGLAAGWMAACALVLLDVVGGVLPGLGIPFDVAGMLSRVGGLAGAVLLAGTGLAYQRRLDPTCLRCTRTRPWAATEVTPRWAIAAAWVAVVGCVTRLLAQVVVGFDAIPLEAGASMLLFELGFVLAGTALPLLLVYRLGRVFPRWMLLWPGAGLGVGITAYFGVGLVQMILAAIAGEPVYGGELGDTFPAAFFWVAVPAYLVWGAGLAMATYGYYLRTRKPCAGCGR